jgi:hypothetical protein
MTTPALRTRKPTGVVPWPLILVEGAEKAGKSWSLAVLSASPRVGQTYWIDLGEGAADEYGAVPGARYLVVEHDGSFNGVYAAVEAVYAEAKRAADAGEPPVVLGIDSMTAEWDLLKDWATERAKGSKSNREKLARDPLAEITVSQNYWNDATSRHKKLMRLLMTFPGVCVMTARGKVVTAVEDGKPVEGKKAYRVEGHKDLGSDATCWVRLSRDTKPIVVGARSVHNGIRPGIDDPQVLPDDWTLEWLIFEALKCNPATAHARNLTDLRPDRTPEQIRDEAVREETSPARMRELYSEAKTVLAVEVPNEHGKDEALGDLLIRLGKARAAAAAPPAAKNPGNDPARRRMMALFTQVEITDRDERLAYCADVVGHDVESTNKLTDAEVQAVIERLESFVKQMEPAEAVSA